MKTEITVKIIGFVNATRPTTVAIAEIANILQDSLPPSDYAVESIAAKVIEEEQ